MKAETLIIERESPDKNEILRIYKSSGIGDENGDPRRDLTVITDFCLSSDNLGDAKWQASEIEKQEAREAEVFKLALAKLSVYVYENKGAKLFVNRHLSIPEGKHAGYAYITMEKAAKFDLLDSSPLILESIIKDDVDNYNLFVKGESYNYSLFKKGDADKTGRCGLTEVDRDFGYLGAAGINKIYSELGADHWNEVSNVTLSPQAQREHDATADFLSR